VVRAKVATWNRQLIDPDGSRATTPERRHKYGRLDNYLGFDLFIQPSIGGKTLYFRDIGNVAAIADTDEHVHMIMDDSTTDDNGRIKFYWCIGDLATGKWDRLWLVHRDPRFVNRSDVNIVQNENQLLGFMQYDAYEGDKLDKGESCLLVLQWDAQNGFGKKIRLASAADLYFDAAHGNGRFVAVVFSEPSGVYLLSYDGARWTKPALLGEKYRNVCRQVNIISLGQARFQIVFGAGEESTVIRFGEAE